MKNLIRGFTLTELLIVLAIFAILTVAAAPSFIDTIERSRVESVQNDLLRDITYARQEALSRNTLVTVCQSSDGVSCAAGGDWDQGWIIVTETAGGVAGNVEAGEEVLRIHSAIHAQDRLEGSSDFIQFTSTGAVGLPAAGTPLFLACSPNNSYVRSVMLLRAGRAIGSGQAGGLCVNG